MRQGHISIPILYHVCNLTKRYQVCIHKHFRKIVSAIAACRSIQWIPMNAGEAHTKILSLNFRNFLFTQPKIYLFNVRIYNFLVADGRMGKRAWATFPIDLCKCNFPNTNNLSIKSERIEKFGERKAINTTIVIKCNFGPEDSSRVECSRVSCLEHTKRQRVRACVFVWEFWRF